MLFLAVVGLVLFNSIVFKHQEVPVIQGATTPTPGVSEVRNTTLTPGVARIDENNWPSHAELTDWLPLPTKASVIDHQDELVYFNDWIGLLNEGIANRYNMEAGLAGKRRPQDLSALRDLFADKQNTFLGKIKLMNPPERLAQFHDKFVQAAHYQIEFYRDYAEAKANDPAVQLKDLLNNSYLKQCNELLWAAYYEFQRLYPNADRATNAAIEMRLCQFDII